MLSWWCLSYLLIFEFHQSASGLDGNSSLVQTPLKDDSSILKCGFQNLYPPVSQENKREGRKWGKGKAGRQAFSLFSVCPSHSLWCTHLISRKEWLVSNRNLCCLNSSPDSPIAVNATGKERENFHCQAPAVFRGHPVLLHVLELKELLCHIPLLPSPLRKIAVPFLLNISFSTCLIIFHLARKMYFVAHYTAL